MANVLLVNCDCHNFSKIRECSSLFSVLDRIFNLRILKKPLNTIYLGASLIESGHECKILDLQTCKEKARKGVFKRYAKGRDWVGFSCTTASYPEAKEMAEICRK